VLAISYTKTKPKNDQLTLINPKYIIFTALFRNKCRYPKSFILDQIKFYW